MPQALHLRLVPPPPKLRHRILHCMRAPVGGLFRHVRDLAREQVVRGHEVGVLCDLEASDPLTEARLAGLRPALALGVSRVAMSREIGLADIAAARATYRLAEESRIDVLHGHGAKGGAYARIAAHMLRRAGRRVACLYTPHGGSLHYRPATVKGRLFMAAERALLACTDGLIFESRFAADTFMQRLGPPPCPSRVIHNGLLAEELRTITAAPDAADFLFIGELRRLKGVDVLLDALALLARERPVRAVIVGAGPDADQFWRQIRRLGLADRVEIKAAMPAREAFRLGRVLVVPSRAESLPYVVLEAAGAGIPLIATRVGGIPEIVEGTDSALVAPEDVAGLAAAMRAALDSPIRMIDCAGRLQRAVADRFSVATMTARVLELYAMALESRSIADARPSVRAQEAASG